MSAGSVPLLTDREIERLMIGLAYHKGAEGFDVGEASEVVAWAEETRQRARMLEQLLGDESDSLVTVKEQRRRRLAGGPMNALANKAISTASAASGRSMSATANSVRTALIRPPDPAFERDMGVRIRRYTNNQAVRLLAHCCLRDAHTALDLTFGAGTFWKGQRPPSLSVTGNNIDPKAPTDLHVDFTDTGLQDGSYDLVVYDPPHLPHLGETSFMGKRFGTVRSTAGFRTQTEAGALEAWRIARVGIIVKLADAPNGGAYLPATSWAVEALGVWPVYVLHSIGRPSPRPPGEIARMPRNNGADWLVFRKDGNRYPDFIKLYARQMSRLGLGPKCPMCDMPMPEGRRSIARTCSDACRQRARRQRSAS